MMLPPAVIGVVIISSPGSRSSAPAHTCRAAVPDVVVIACLTPCFAAHAASNSRTLGPLCRLPDRITSAAAFTSSSPNS